MPLGYNYDTNIPICNTKLNEWLLRPIKQFNPVTVLLKCLYQTKTVRGTTTYDDGHAGYGLGQVKDMAGLNA